jgi:molybdopterin molybdotransferase
LDAAVTKAVTECDVVLISGGSSGGAKDQTARVIEKNGSILLHGIAMKPGKPTILGVIGGKPVFGLPGHPVAAYFVSQLFVRPLLDRLLGHAHISRPVTARLASAVSSNHGRAEYIGVRLDSASEMPAAARSTENRALSPSCPAQTAISVYPRDCEGIARARPFRSRFGTNIREEILWV